MSRCPSCYQNSCPETPDITLNQTFLQFDGSNAFYHEERFATIVLPTVVDLPAPQLPEK